MDNAALIFNVLFSIGIFFGILYLIYTRYFIRVINQAQKSLSLFVLFFTLNNIQIILVDNFTTQADCFVNNLHPFLFFVFVVPYFHSFIVYYLQIENKVVQYIRLAQFLFGCGMVARILFLPYFNLGNCYAIGSYVKAEEIVIASFSVFLFIKIIEIIFFRTKLFAFVLSFDRLRWIKQFLFFGGLVLLFWIVAIVFNLKNIVSPKIFIYYPLRLGSSFLLYLVSYNGCFKNILTDERIEIREFSKDLKLTTNLTFEETNHLISPRMQHILDYIIASNCYLDPTLNLEKFSKLVKIDRKTISKEISLSDKSNFNDLINFYRIERAKIVLQDPKYKVFNNEAIGFECGFNAKSTFYDAFKKFTQKTPNDFKI